jgi:hypothetical protein
MGKSLKGVVARDGATGLEPAASCVTRRFTARGTAKNVSFDSMSQPDVL